MPRRRKTAKKRRTPGARRQAVQRAATRTTTLRGWAKWPRERLLGARICDLGLKLEGSELKPRIRQLHKELKTRGFVFRPHFWLSDEWYSPDGIPGIAMPFYLAHPRLKRLEKELMLEVEGGDRDSCMKLLRHETAHALLNAYRLNRRRDWQQHFGNSSAKYPETYLPQPYSKRYVLHLANWYAQSHPHEDWAETFAVWLKPNSDWRKRYKGWPALKKLQYVDQLMKEIRGRTPRYFNQRTTLEVGKLRMTLGDYYADKQERYGEDSPEFFDRDLKKMFTDAPEHKKSEKASRYIRRVRMEIIDIVARWTSEYDYRISEVLKEMTERCDELNLRVVRSDEELKPEMTACLTMLVMSKLHSGGFHVSV